jgi:SPP1 family predicted phage head-tail adaptor
MRTDMRHKITIKSPHKFQNEYGEIINEDFYWEEVATNVWAAKEPILGREFFAAEAVQSKVEVKFRTYYLKGIDNTMRIFHGNDVYEILSSIDPKGLNRELLFYCKKVK